ncbi:DUF3251 domain-containing protein [Escherichia fergusonii]|uniref:DUF3251 domain-containing protein n=1 Tax=Escherichia fergusonii TaxID=564 RepID=UPI003EE29EE9
MRWSELDEQTQALYPQQNLRQPVRIVIDSQNRVTPEHRLVQQSEVRQMKHSVSTLNKEMTQLNEETIKITQQNKLNAKSQSGVYLLPGSNTPARLESQIGTLRMSLMNISPATNGTALTLRIQGESSDPLPAFSGTFEYGQIQGTTENFQEVNVQNQLINAPASILAPSDVDIPLQLNGISPDQLGFVRIHDIQPVSP